MRNSVLCLMGLTMLLVNCGCRSILASPTAPAPSARKSLYDRIGGAGTITAVVEDFVDRAATDPQANFMRGGIPGAEWDPNPESLKTLKSQLVDYISQVSGGPHNYKGKSMQEAHAKMKITSAEFDATAADLKAALDRFCVTPNEQAELLRIVIGTKKEIVTVE